MSDLIDPTIGSARELVDETEARELEEIGLLIRDDRRRRPLYFDGRFLAAQDLTREQNYFLTRQADLGRAGGSGVVTGLQVRRGTTATTIQIATGHGVTPSGEIVVLPDPLTLDIADVPEMQRLDSVFGLSLVPRSPGRNLTGLFIVGLRPVEFTSNQIASYPTTLTGERSVNDGDIIEAVAVSLIPYSDGRTPGELALRRSYAAYDLFVARSEPKLPASILPLAVVALDRGLVAWVDEFLVRREVGAEGGDILSFGLASRALREAFVIQYDRHLSDLLSQSGGRGFAAASQFKALPPVGRLPQATINTEDFSQLYFPAEVDAELTLVPEDELPALINEGLLLPPIDLTQEGDALASTAVMILVPVPRHELAGWQAQLENRLTLPLRSAAPGLIARRRPLEALRGLKLARPLTPPVITPDLLGDNQWQRLVQGQETLWYVRQRQIPFQAELLASIPILQEPPTDVVVPPPGDGGGDNGGQPGVQPGFDPIEDDPNVVEPDEELEARMRTYGLKMRYDALRENTSVDAVRLLIRFLLLPKFLEAKVMMWGAMADLEFARQAGQLEEIDERVVRQVSRSFRQADASGVRLLNEASEEMAKDRTVIRNLAFSGQVPLIDEIGRIAFRTGDRPFIQTVAQDLAQLAAEFADFDPEAAEFDRLQAYREEIGGRIQEIHREVRQNA